MIIVTLRVDSGVRWMIVNGFQSKSSTDSRNFNVKCLQTRSPDLQNRRTKNTIFLKLTLDHRSLDRRTAKNKTRRFARRRPVIIAFYRVNRLGTECRYVGVADYRSRSPGVGYP